MVILLDEPTYSVHHNFAERPLHEVLSFHECPNFSNQGCFNLKIYKRKSQGIQDQLIATICREGTWGQFEAEVNVKADYMTESDLLTSVRSTSKGMLSGRVTGSVSIRIEFKFPSRTSLMDDLERYLESGPKVTLLGKNGNVTVSKILVEMRSTALEAMFRNDMVESKSLTIDTKPSEK